MMQNSVVLTVEDRDLDPPGVYLVVLMADFAVLPEPLVFFVVNMFHLV
jgi:hypothetical protein